MHDPDVDRPMKAAADRQVAVTTLQRKYAQGQGLSSEQLVLDMQELLSTERVVLDSIITLFVKLGELVPADNSSPQIAEPPAL